MSMVGMFDPTIAIRAAGQQAQDMGLDENDAPARGPLRGVQQMMLTSLIRQLEDAQAREMSRLAEARQRERDENWTGPQAMSPGQLSLIATSGGPKAQAQNMATAQQASWTRAAKRAGLDPDAAYVDAPQAGETEAKYIERIRRQKAEAEQRQREAGQRAKAKYQGQKLGRVLRGETVQRGKLVVKQPGAAASPQREADAVAAARGRGGASLASDAGMADAQRKIADPGRPLPAAPDTYRSSIYLPGKGRMELGRDFASADEASAAADRALQTATGPGSGPDMEARMKQARALDLLRRWAEPGAMSELLKMAE